MDDIKNLGLIQEQPDAFDWVVGGGESPVIDKVKVPTGDWTPYLPIVEYQNNSSFDRMACVSYSLLNVVEVLLSQMTGKEYNFSDRFLAKISGTGHQGNLQSRVFDALRQYGVCTENQYPDDSTTWDEYYKNIPDNVVLLAKDFLNEWTPYREWVTNTTDDIVQALQYSPLQVTVAYASGDGILNPKGDYNHCVMLYGFKYGEYWEIYDHYSVSKKRYAWNYKFGSILKTTLTPTSMKVTFKQNQAYVLVQGNEQKVGIYIDGVVNDKQVKGLLVGDKIDVIINSTSRLKEKYLITPLPVTLEVWDSVNHYDMRGNIIE